LSQNNLFIQCILYLLYTHTILLASHQFCNLYVSGKIIPVQPKTNLPGQNLHVVRKTHTHITHTHTHSHTHTHTYTHTHHIYMHFHILTCSFLQQGPCVQTSCWQDTPCPWQSADTSSGGVSEPLPPEHQWVVYKLITTSKYWMLITYNSDGIS